MCINCATRKHTEEYDHVIITRKRQEATKVFAVCSKCGQRCSNLKGYQKLKHRTVGVSFCFDCKFLKINDKEITVE